MSLKIILLEDGNDPRLETVVGDNPADELNNLLDGAVKFEELAPHLRLVTRRYGYEQRLPIRYRVDTARLSFPVYGSCAVVRVNDANQMCDVAEKLDLESVCRRIRSIGRE